MTVNNAARSCWYHRYRRTVVVEVQDGLPFQKTARICSRCGKWRARDLKEAREYYQSAIQAGLNPSAVPLLKNAGIEPKDTCLSQARHAAPVDQWALYPFLVMCAFLPFTLYMHHSKTGPRGVEIDGLVELIAYLHADQLLYALLALTFFALKPLRSLSLMAFAAVYYLATFDWLSWHVQHKAFFFADVYRALQIILYYPEFLHELPAGLKIKTTLLLLLPVLVAIGLRIKPIRGLLSGFRKLAAAVTLCIVLATPWLISNAYTHYNSFIHMFSEQLHDRKLDVIPADRDSMKATLGLLETAMDTSNFTTESLAGDNVVIFIIETAPYSHYPDLIDLASTLEHPWLKKHGLLFTRHYSTYPATDRASYSILSGLYPPMLHHNNWKESLGYGDSLPKALAAHGYGSHLFSTAPLAFYDDDAMYKNLGFSNLHEVEETQNLRVKTEKGYQWDRGRLYEMDETLIRKVTKHIRAHTQNQHARPFLATIAPQSSHAPFQCPPMREMISVSCRTEGDKIRLNAQWQMGLIEQIVKALETAGILNNTLLIVTGDHGIRSKQETPSFPNPHLLQSVSYHVPLLVASSRFANAPRRIDHPTSHVDITPTVLDLLEIPRDEFFFHGRNLFADTPRTLYFIGTGYSPASGYLKDGRYFMENRSNDLFLSAPNMNFNDNNQVSRDQNIRPEISGELLRIEAFLRNEYASGRRLMAH